MPEFGKGVIKMFAESCIHANNSKDILFNLMSSEKVEFKDRTGNNEVRDIRFSNALEKETRRALSIKKESSKHDVSNVRSANDTNDVNDVRSANDSNDANDVKDANEDKRVKGKKDIEAGKQSESPINEYYLFIIAAIGDYLEGKRNIDIPVEKLDIEQIKMMQNSITDLIGNPDSTAEILGLLQDMQCILEEIEAQASLIAHDNARGTAHDNARDIARGTAHDIGKCLEEIQIMRENVIENNQKKGFSKTIVLNDKDASIMSKKLLSSENERNSFTVIQEEKVKENISDFFNKLELDNLADNDTNDSTIDQAIKSEKEFYIKPENSADAEFPLLYGSVVPEIFNDRINTSVIQKAFPQSNTFRDEIISRIAGKAKLLVTDEQSEITIDLKPESLGKMVLKGVAENDNVTARLLTENNIVKEVIEANFQLLKESLEKQGLIVQDISVSVMDRGYDNNSFDRRNNERFAQGVKKAKSVNNLASSIYNISSLQSNVNELASIYAWPDSTINLMA